jgi:ribosomal protein L7/L12
MLSRHQYTTVCDNLDTILQVVPNNVAINIAVRQLQVMLTEQLLADVKKVSNDKNLTNAEVGLGTSKGKIPCVQAYRERTGGGLKESKEFVEDYFTKHNLNFGQTSW